MGNLLDNIKNAALRSKQPQGQLGGATEATAQDLRASTGKASSGAPSGLSNVQEQLGIAQQPAQLQAAEFAASGESQLSNQQQQAQQDNLLFYDLLKFVSTFPKPVSMCSKRELVSCPNMLTEHF